MKGSRDEQETLKVRDRDEIKVHNHLDLFKVHNHPKFDVICFHRYSLTGVCGLHCIAQFHATGDLHVDQSEQNDLTIRADSSNYSVYVRERDQLTS